MFDSNAMVQTFQIRSNLYRGSKIGTAVQSTDIDRVDRVREVIHLNRYIRGTHWKFRESCTGNYV